MKKPSIRSSRRILGSMLTTPIVVTMSSCGLGSHSEDPFSGVGDDGTHDRGRLVAVEGLKYSSFEFVENRERTGQERKEISGVTDMAGQFVFGASREQQCSVDETTKEQKCTNTGPTTYQPVTLSLCGVALPVVTRTGGSGVLTLTPWDLFGDVAAARNLASVLLMANVNTGDPALTGIKVSSTLQQGTCGDLNWATTNIQRDAASFQAAAGSDGQRHEWPTEQEVTDYLNYSYFCSRLGLHSGIHLSDPEALSLRGQMWGNLGAVVDLQGGVAGYLDFTGDYSLAPTTEPIPFSGSVEIDPSGVGHVSYVGGPDGPLTNLNISLTIFSLGTRGTWTADGGIGGSTARSDRPFGMGVNQWPYIQKYRFGARNVSYQRTGAAAPQSYNLIINVGYNGDVYARLSRWPEYPRRNPDGSTIGIEPALGLSGRRINDALILKWDDVSDGTPTTKATMTLTLDRATTSLTGTLTAKDGGDFITFTNEQPLQGCRL